MTDASAAAFVLTGTDYTQTFDGVGTGLPAGFDVRTGATASTLGTIVAFNTAQVIWSSTTAQYANYASSDGLTSASATAAQNASTDRVIGFRQSGSFADPGAAIDFNFDATSAEFSGAGTALTLSLQMLSVQGRSTPLTIQYGVGASPSTFIDLATYNDLGSFGTTPFTLTGTQLAPLSGVSNAWIRVVALSASSGANNRDTIGLDDFSLAFGVRTSTVTGFFWIGSDTTLGGSGTWDQTTASSWSASSTTITPTTWNTSQTANFGGAEATNEVTVSGTVGVGAGMSFTTNGYRLSGGTLNFTAANAAANSISVSTGTTTLALPLTGTNGASKIGAGRLLLSGDNSGLSGGITLSAGALVIGSTKALGTNALALNGGTLTSSDATAYTISSAIVLGGDVGFGEASTGALTLSGPIDFSGGTRLLDVGTGVSVQISGATSNGGLTKAGAGELKFAVSNSLTTLGVNAGSVVIDSGVTLTLTSAFVASSGGTLTVNGTLLYSGSTDSTTIGGTVAFAAGSKFIQTGTGTPSPFLFSANTTLDPSSTTIFRDYDFNPPSVSNRTYVNNLTFETTAATFDMKPVAGSGIWNVNGDLTIGAGLTFNYASNNGLTTNFKGNIVVNGNLGGTFGARSFTVASGKTLSVGSGGAVVMAAGQMLTVSGTLTGTGSVTDLTVATGGTLSPGNSPGTLAAGNTIFQGGGSYKFELNSDGTGTAGTNWDLLAITGKLDMASLTAQSPFVLKLQTLTATNANGSLAAWDSTSNHTWSNIVTTTGGLTGFSSSLFAVDTSGFANPFIGQFSVISLDNNNLTLQYLAVPEPSVLLSLVFGGSILLSVRRARRLV